ncbi:Tyrosyl-DNA phosphodiesterase I [Trinorchestia longiramus]|nr:Tyrosyl-DNA phosphodiesterase I [Trinorchestia longiramus]
MSGSGSDTNKRPLCKYGALCYRVNPDHKANFRHPSEATSSIGSSNTSNKNINKASTSCSMALPSESRTPLKRSLNEDTSKDVIPVKKNKHNKDESSAAEKLGSKSFAVRLSNCSPYRLFFNKNFSVKATHKDPLGVVLPDLLSPSLGQLVETAQLNFLVDLDFVHQNYESCGIADLPLLVLYGEVEGDQKLFKNITCRKVAMPFLYGTHHTKMMLLLYTTGLRVVVHTANLRTDDWYEKTQGVWISPLFPKIEVDGTDAGDSTTHFRQDLVTYLQSYKQPALSRWCDIIRKHDFSSCKAVFVGHVPGYHVGPQKNTWGHMKLRSVLAPHSSAWRSATADCTTVVQCSSIGSLGKDSSSWVTTELCCSLGGGVACPPKRLSVVYPSEENIRTSSQGWGGGSCLPYNSNTHAKQQWLRTHMRQWKSSRCGRSEAMPHIKTYCRVDGLMQKAQYLLVTSANLSKAAWGQLQKQNSQLFIRSYEAGVLLLPQIVIGKDWFPLSDTEDLPGLPVPYDLPLTPYGPTDVPWFMDTRKTTKDVYGETYDVLTLQACLRDGAITCTTPTSRARLPHHVHDSYITYRTPTSRTGLPHHVQDSHITYRTPTSRTGLPHHVQDSHITCTTTTSRVGLPHHVQDFHITCTTPISRTELLHHVHDSHITCRIPTSRTGLPYHVQDSHISYTTPHHAQDSHIMCTSPTSRVGCPHQVQNSHIVCKTPTSRVGLPHFVQDSHLTHRTST